MTEHAAEHPTDAPADTGAEPDTATPSEVSRAAADAASRGLAVTFLTRGQDGRPTHDHHAGLPIVKSIVVQRGDSYVFVLTPLHAQFSWAKLRAHLGVNRLSLPDADAAFAATGYRRGTITPLGSSTAWPVILDRSLAGQTVLLGAGSPGMGARVQAEDFVRAYGAEVADLSGTPAAADNAVR
ncbi:aminoacyl-tRNA deacylase [Leucobacter sp. M11]|uniref:aminoacyl-tRNA deacylase n=1 Tax=Leucobacter sp. M11 TaxID=2993565 RepID=UPI002D7E1D8D|nr:YbaK/EbsC family protein [Leucobacter sp. M11]MEB4616398.1 YbaK/EbsC family protein [Leucobacter sp. M11]